MKREVSKLSIAAYEGKDADYVILQEANKNYRRLPEDSRKSAIRRFIEIEKREPDYTNVSDVYQVVEIGRAISKVGLGAKRKKPKKL